VSRLECCKKNDDRRTSCLASRGLGSIEITLQARAGLKEAKGRLREENGKIESSGSSEKTTARDYVTAPSQVRPSLSA
jgi:hypothetical protein